MAEAAGTARLILTVWANDTPAIRVYLSMGMMVTDMARMKREGFPCLLLIESREDILSYAELCAGRAAPGHPDRERSGLLTTKA
ncbi:hypothetical protein [Cupriavidus necator]